MGRRYNEKNVNKRFSRTIDYLHSHLEEEQLRLGQGVMLRYSLHSPIRVCIKTIVF